MMTRTGCCIVAALGMLVAQAGAAPYWITYEGNDFPENEGWTRYWGNWDGPYEGDGAIRTVENGVLTMDSLFDTGVYDFAYVERPGQVDPGPGETFVMEWRVLVEQTVGEPYFDAEISLGSDDAWLLGFGMYPNAVVSSFEDVTVPVQPGVFHEYRAISADMRTYGLYIDGQLALVGDFWEGLTHSRVVWGDGVQGVASRSRWDYFRVGVVPEPTSSLLFLMLCAYSSHTLLGGFANDKEV
jgi:hypothetical protein